MPLTIEPQAVLYRAPLLTGDAGTAQTIEKIRELVNDAWGDPDVAAYGAALMQNWQVAQHDQMAEARAVWYDAKGFHFVNDPFTKEVLHPVWDLLQTRVGDCDDINALVIPALLGSVGIESRLVTIAADKRDPSVFSHIYAEAHINGEWIPMDAARPHAQFGVEAPQYFRREWWSLTSSEHENYPGPGLVQPLTAAGYRRSGMGDLTPYSISEIGGGLTQVAAGIDTAVNGQPVIPALANPIGPGGYMIGGPSIVPMAPPPASGSSPMGLLLIAAAAFAIWAFAS